MIPGLTHIVHILLSNCDATIALNPNATYAYASCWNALQSKCKISYQDLRI